MTAPDWPIPDEVVEALARSLHEAKRTHYEYGTTYWRNEREDTRESYRQDAREFLESHRLVQLPEEPDTWEVESSDHGFERCTDQRYREHAEWVVRQHTAYLTGRIRPLYVIPGQPITVEEENDGE